MNVKEIDRINGVSLEDIYVRELKARDYRSLIVVALKVALDEFSPIYSVGFHPQLFLRIAEMVSQMGARQQKEVRDFIDRALAQAKPRSLAFGEILQVVRIGFKLGRNTCQYLPLSASDCPKIPRNADTVSRSRKMVIAVHPDQIIEAPVAYGAHRATMAVADEFRAFGYQTILVGLSASWFGSWRGHLFIGTKHNIEVEQVVHYLDRVGTLIGISRADVFLSGHADKFIIYQQEAIYPRGNVPVSFLNLAQVQMICPSRCSLETQASRGFNKSALHVVHYGYDRKVFFQNSPEPIRKRHGLVFCGVTTRLKGVDIILLAFQKIVQTYPDSALIFCGRNTKSWADEPPHLLPQRWIDAAGCIDWSKICTEVPGVSYAGELEQAEIANLFRTNSLLLMASHSEVFPLVTIEAQACGCIPILPRLLGFPETIIENETGYLYERLDPDCLADAVIRIWDQGLPTSDQRVLAAKRVAENHDWHRTAIQIESAIQKAKPVPNYGRIALRALYQWRCFWVNHPSIKWRFLVLFSIVRKLFALIVPIKK